MQLVVLNEGANPVPVQLQLIGADGSVFASGNWSIPAGKEFAASAPPEVFSFNAGNYQVRLTLKAAGSLRVKSLSVK
jgi:hypothetical protein